MPIRKIKYFIENRTKKGLTLDDYLIENSTIESIKKFHDELFERNTKFIMKNDGKIRIYIKGSYNFEHMCIVKSNTIVKALNNELIDQEQVNNQIQQIRNKSRNWIFKGNLFENRCVKNYKGQLRDDPVTLILGHIEADNELIWISKKDLCDTLEKICVGKL